MLLPFFYSDPPNARTGELGPLITQVSVHVFSKGRLSGRPSQGSCLHSKLCAQGAQDDSHAGGVKPVLLGLSFVHLLPLSTTSRALGVGVWVAPGNGGRPGWEPLWPAPAPAPYSRGEHPEKGDTSLEGD